MFATSFWNSLFMNHNLIVTEPQGMSHSFCLGCLSSGEHEVHWRCGGCGQFTGRKLLFTECIWQTGSSFPFTFPALLRSVNSFCLLVSLISILLTPNTQSEPPEGGSILVEDFHYRTLWEQLTTLCSFLLTLISYLISGIAEWKSYWCLRSDGDIHQYPSAGEDLVDALAWRLLRQEFICWAVLRFRCI